MFKRFLKDETAQGMTEYILIIALIAMVCVGAIKLFGEQINVVINTALKKIKDNVPKN